MSATLDALKAKGIDLGAPAPFTTHQLDVIGWQLGLVDGEASTVVVAALQGYGESVLLHPSVTSVTTTAKTPREDKDTIQWAAHTDMSLADALEAYDSDGDLFDWLTLHIDQAFKARNANAKVLSLGPETTLTPAKDDKSNGRSTKSKTERKQEAKSSAVWLAAVLAGALVVLCVYHGRRG